MKISVLAAVYNEERFVSSLLERVTARNEPSEIIVVNDGSTDGTLALLREAAGRDSRMKILDLPVNGGKGAAIRAGLREVTGEIVIIQDADLEYSPEEYPMLLDPFKDPAVKVVYGSRMLNKNNKFSYLTFVMGGMFLTFLTNLLFFSKITDEPTGYKVFRTEVIKDLGLISSGFEFCPEVTAKVLRRGIRILEVPISYCPRTLADGKKIRFRDGIIAILTLLRYRFSE